MGTLTTMASSRTAPPEHGHPEPPVGRHEETHDPLHREQQVRSDAEVLPQGRLERADRPRAAAELTPYLHRIDVEGDRWTWNVDEGAGPRQVDRHHLHRGDDLRRAEPDRRSPTTRERTDETTRCRGRVPPRGGRLRHAASPSTSASPSTCRSPRPCAVAVEGAMRGRDGRRWDAASPTTCCATWASDLRILVLGATGYVGSRVVPALLDAGHEVVAASSSRARPRAGSPGATRSTGCAATSPTTTAVARGADRTSTASATSCTRSTSRAFADRDRRGADGACATRSPRAAYAASSTCPAWCRTFPSTSSRAPLLPARGRAGARRGRLASTARCSPCAPASSSEPGRRRTR